MLPGCSSSVETYRVAAEAMSPTINRGEVVRVNVNTYSDGDPIERWDIVLVQRGGYKYPYRVVGLPGEDLGFSENGGIMINGRSVRKPSYLTSINYELHPWPGKQRAHLLLDHPVSVGEQQYYIVGDNVTQAKDSRFFGPIPKRQIIGKIISHK
jgi:signal peptidase I